MIKWWAWFKKKQIKEIAICSDTKRKKMIDLYWVLAANNKSISFHLNLGYGFILTFLVFLFTQKYLHVSYQNVGKMQDILSTKHVERNKKYKKYYKLLDKAFIWLLFRLRWLIFFPAITTSLSHCTIIEMLAIGTNRVAKITVFLFESIPAICYFISCFGHCFGAKRIAKLYHNQEGN